ncbi:helix-turn-helix transcriptional regulator [Gordonibacter sp. Marseille-P4307]|uniref:helix-turn-helix domain-containing protein n=1 Tax=Gordonibacter sp. Marseille-P4307 TaxID=2161815 RepID=UPI000F533971|nr:helix-turn-helix transcriptional regulator [Gordonibacter sp. Marseille-P4307]
MFDLSQRESEVLVLLGKGRTIEITADKLNISFNTAKTHIRQVYGKLGVHTRQQLLDLIEQKKGLR